MSGFSLNARAGALADQLVRDAQLLRIGVAQGPAGETLVDCGVDHPGGIEAGLALAAITMGGIGTVSLSASESAPRWPWHVAVRTADPVTACLASQYAGWALKHKRASIRRSVPARPARWPARSRSSTTSGTGKVPQGGARCGG
jgi:methenyltetrahydromethanopterin cyclohydrolase